VSTPGPRDRETKQLLWGVVVMTFGLLALLVVQSYLAA